MKSGSIHSLISKHKIVLGVLSILGIAVMVTQVKTGNTTPFTGSTSIGTGRAGIQFAQIATGDGGAAAGDGSVIPVDLDFSDASVKVQYKNGFTQVRVIVLDNLNNVVATPVTFFGATYGKTGAMGVVSGLCPIGNPVTCDRLISQGEVSLGVSGFPPGGKCYLRLSLSVSVDGSSGYREQNPNNNYIRIIVPSEHGATEECPSTSSSSSSNTSISRTSSSTTTSTSSHSSSSNGQCRLEVGPDGYTYLICPNSSSSTVSSQQSSSRVSSTSVSSRTNISSSANGPDVVLGITTSRQDDYIAFRYIARNDGNLDTSGYLETQRPSGYTFEPLQSPTCRQLSNGLTVRCYTASADRYMAGSTRQHVAVFRRASPTAPCTVQNAARVVIVGTADRNLSNNTDSASVTLLNCGQISSSSTSVSRPNISSSVSRTSSSSQSALPDITLNTQATTVNDTALFRYTIANNGSRTTAGYIITQRPSGYAFDPLRSEKCQLLTNGISVQCLPYDGSTTLPAGSKNQAVAAFRKVSDAVSCVAMNSADVVITGTPDSTPGDNRSTAQVTIELCGTQSSSSRSISSSSSSSSQRVVQPEVSLEVASYQSQDTVSFRYLVVNRGNAATTGYIITQRPGGYVFDAQNSTNCKIFPNGNTLQCVPPVANNTIGPSTSHVMIAAFRRVSSAASCTANNTAVLVITGPANSTPGYNRKTHSITLYNCGSSSSSLQSSAPPLSTPNVSLESSALASGDAVIFRYKLINSGDTPTTGYVLTLRPSGYTFDAQQSEYCTLHANGTYVQCLPSAAGTSILGGRSYNTHVVFRRVSATVSCTVENLGILVVTGTPEANITDNRATVSVRSALCTE